MVNYLIPIALVVIIGAVAYVYLSSSTAPTITVATTTTPTPAPTTTAATMTVPRGNATGPVTKLHYTPNSNFEGSTYEPGSDGFNLADISSASEANSLPSGVLGLVYLGATGGVNATFENEVDQAIGNRKVYGFYLADDPLPSVKASNLKAESDYIHHVDPGAKTFIILYNNASPFNPSYILNASNTDIDLFGLDSYPIRPPSEDTRFASGYNYTVIGAAVREAEVEGIPRNQLIPVYQTFGGGGYSSYTLPNASEERIILSTWAEYLPSPAFDYAYSWGVQENDTALSEDPSLQAVFLAHNTGT